MKIWYGHGSEHSMNLVMIGRFKDVGEAEKAKQFIDEIAGQVNADVENGLMQIGVPPERFTSGMEALLRKLRFYTVRPEEIEQFAWDVTVVIQDEQVIVTTEESDISAFLKLLVDGGARVEVYSADDDSDTGV